MIGTNDRLRSLSMSMSNLSSKISSLNSIMKRNAKADEEYQKMLLEGMLELLKSQQRIEEHIVEQTEILKYHAGLESKFDNNAKTNTNTNIKINTKKKFF